MLLLVLVLQNIFAAIYAIVNRKVAKNFRDLHWHQTAAVFIIMYACGLVYALPQGNIDYTTSFDYLHLLVLNGFCFGIGTGVAYLAFRDQDAGVVNTNLMIRVPVAAMLAVILLGQSLSPQNLFGALLVIFGVFLASYISSEKASWRPKKSTIYALVAGALMGIGIVSEKLTLTHIDINTFIVTSFPFEMLFLVIFTIPSLKKWPQILDKSLIVPTISMGVIRFIGGFLFIWALANSMNTSLIAASSGLQAVFTVMLAALLIGETNNLFKKLIAAAIVCAGILLMFFN